MDVIRVNIAYAKTQQEWEELCQVFKTAFKNKGKKCPVCIDLGGPSFRLTNFPNDSPIKLRAGDTIYITTNRHVATTTKIFYCDLAHLPFFLASGNKIIIDYGRTSLTVQSIEKESTVLTSIGAASPMKSYKVVVEC